MVKTQDIDCISNKTKRKHKSNKNDSQLDAFKQLKKECDIIKQENKNLKKTIQRIWKNGPVPSLANIKSRHKNLLEKKKNW